MALVWRLLPEENNVVDPELVEEYFLPKGYFAWRVKDRPGTFLISEGYQDDDPIVGVVILDRISAKVGVFTNAPSAGFFELALRDKYSGIDVVETG